MQLCIWWAAELGNTLPGPRPINNIHNIFFSTLQLILHTISLLTRYRTTVPPWVLFRAIARLGIEVLEDTTNQVWRSLHGLSLLRHNTCCLECALCPCYRLRGSSIVSTPFGSPLYTFCNLQSLLRCSSRFFPLWVYESGMEHRIFSYSYLLHLVAGAATNLGLLPQQA